MCSYQLNTLYILGVLFSAAGPSTCLANMNILNQSGIIASAACAGTTSESLVNIFYSVVGAACAQDSLQCLEWHRQRLIRSVSRVHLLSTGHQTKLLIDRTLKEVKVVLAHMCMQVPPWCCLHARPVRKSDSACAVGASPPKQQSTVGRIPEIG